MKYVTNFRSREQWSHKSTRKRLLEFQNPLQTQNSRSESDQIPIEGFSNSSSSMDKPRRLWKNGYRPRSILKCDTIESKRARANWNSAVRTIEHLSIQKQFCSILGGRCGRLLSRDGAAMFQAEVLTLLDVGYPRESTAESITMCSIHQHRTEYREFCSEISLAIVKAELEGDHLRRTDRRTEWSGYNKLVTQNKGRLSRDSRVFSLLLCGMGENGLAVILNKTELMTANDR